MASHGVTIRPDKFFKGPDLFSSHDLNSPIYTVLAFVPFPDQGNVGLGTQVYRPHIAEFTSNLREIKPQLGIGSLDSFSRTSELWGISQLSRHDTKEVPWQYRDDRAWGRDHPRGRSPIVCSFSIWGAFIGYETYVNGIIALRLTVNAVSKDFSSAL